ncbi:MAG: type IV pilus modification PilV family protein, partial [Planctomycetota bacterium]
MQTDTRGGRPGAARGFTLIEILMAMMVLSIGLASVLSVFIVGLRSSRR